VPKGSISKHFSTRPDAIGTIQKHISDRPDDVGTYFYHFKTRPERIGTLQKHFKTRSDAIGTGSKHFWERSDAIGTHFYDFKTRSDAIGTFQKHFKTRSDAIGTGSKMFLDGPDDVGSVFDLSPAAPEDAGWLQLLCSGITHASALLCAGFHPRGKAAGLSFGISGPVTISAFQAADTLRGHWPAGDGFETAFPVESILPVDGFSAGHSRETVSWRESPFLYRRAMASELTPEFVSTLRLMTGRQKLRTAFALYWGARKIKAAALRQQHPDWNEEQVQQKVKEIFLHATT
jgi:hypothetical protein